MNWQKKFIELFLSLKNKIRNNKKAVKIFLIAGIVLFFGFFILSTRTIGSHVYQICYYAQEKYDGQHCVISLMDMVNDSSEPIANRNKAIWALGQLGDERALTFLKGFYKGYKPRIADDNPDELSQYELYKAVKLLDGGVNLGAWVWR